MSGWGKIDTAQDLIQKNLFTHISNVNREVYRPVLQFQFKNGIFLYMRYNDHDEYSYQLIFSQKALDRIRYDNYDAHWDVRTNPHHVHLRFESVGSESKMKGIPFHDIPLLIDEIKKYLFSS